MAVRNYDKMVRDKIPEIIISGGSTPVTDTLTKAEALDYLAKKLAEEAGEYLESREMEELADVIEVVRGILFHSGHTWDELETIRRKKADERGAFEKGIRLVRVED